MIRKGSDSSDTTPFQDLAKTRTAHPTDEHPTLAARLDALGVDVAELIECARVINPTDSAALLLEEIDRLDEVLSQKHLASLAHDLGIQLEPVAQM